MKKIHYLTIATLVGLLALTGCRRGQGSSSKTETTSVTSSTTSVAPSVVSVAVTPKTLTLGIDEQSSLTANVTVTGDVQKTVTWVSSDPSIVSVSSTGVVEGLKEGQVTITCTSTVDTSKSDTSTITVVNKGFLPELIDQGYTYHSSWPESTIKNWIGSGTYAVSTPEDVSKGAYTKAVDASSESVGYLEVVIEGDQVYSYMDKMALEGFHVWVEYLFGLFEINCSVDATKTYEVDPSEMYDEDYEEIIGTSLCFYKTEDLFYDDTLTTNTDWTSDEKDQFVLVDGMEVIPFVQLGSEYVVEAIEYETEGVYEYVIIQDYSLAWEALDEYGDTLVNSGYSYDSENDIYVKTSSVSYMSQYVAFSWGSSGNYIEVGFSLATFDSFPSDLLNAFTADELESKYTIPAPEGSDAESFTYFEGTDETFGNYASIDGYSYSYAEFEDYASTLENDGWDVTYTEQSDEYYGTISATKGKIAISSYYQNEIDYETYEYSDEVGDLIINVFQGEGFEDPGLYFGAKSARVGIGSSYTIKKTLHEIEGDVSFISNHPEIASVDANGVVTGVSEGVAVITGSVTYEDVTYTDTIEITVSEIQYYTKVESSLADYTGTYLIVCEEYSCAFNAGASTIDSACNNVSVTISDDKIEASEELESAAFTFESNGTDTYSIKASTSYIGNNSKGNKIQTSNVSTDFKNTISITDGVATITADDATTLKYNPQSGTERFRFYKSTSSGVCDIALYKLD